MSIRSEASKQWIDLAEELDSFLGVSWLGLETGGLLGGGGSGGSGGF